MPITALLPLAARAGKIALDLVIPVASTFVAYKLGQKSGDRRTIKGIFRVTNGDPDMEVSNEYADVLSHLVNYHRVPKWLDDDDREAVKTWASKHKIPTDGKGRRKKFSADIFTKMLGSLRGALD